MSSGRILDIASRHRAACASNWIKDPPSVDRALQVAGALASVIPPDALHRAWKRLPAAARSRITDRSSSAIAATIVNMALPMGVLVSIPS